MQRKIYKFKQNSPEWYAARLGRVTSSNFAAIMTKPRSKTEQFSKTAETYQNALLAERLTGEFELITGAALDWGTQYESLACQTYEDRNWCEVEPVGFCTLGEFVGSSTDGFVNEDGRDGIIEIKCPYTSKKHIEYLLSDEPPKEYKAQIQGGLWVTGRDFCDFISFDPRIKRPKHRLKIIRVERDEDYIKELEKRVFMFVDEMRKKLEFLGIES